MDRKVCCICCTVTTKKWYSTDLYKNDIENCFGIAKEGELCGSCYNDIRRYLATGKQKLEKLGSRGIRGKKHTLMKRSVATKVFSEQKRNKIYDLPENIVEIILSYCDWNDILHFLVASKSVYSKFGKIIERPTLHEIRQQAENEKLLQLSTTVFFPNPVQKGCIPCDQIFLSRSD